MTGTPSTALDSNGSGTNVVRILVLALLLAGAFLFVRTSWIDEDAFITLRSVANALDGHGPRWNVDERVQSYTHPLWMGVLSVLGALVPDTELAAHLACLVCSCAALGLLAWRLSAAPLGACVALVLCLASRSFVDWSTGGLENPLLHLLLALFALLVRPSAADVDGQRVLPATLCASAIVLTRPDALLFVLPTGAVLLFLGRARGALRALCIGLVPLLAWGAFSLCYYGFPFPNTAYAKLTPDAPLADRCARGLAYLGHTFEHDPLTLVGILAGCAVVVIERNRRDSLLALGALAWVLWVVCIGGDYMSGRMLSAPFFLAAVLVAGSSSFSRARVAGVALAVVAALALVPPEGPVWNGWTRGEAAPPGEEALVGKPEADRVGVELFRVQDERALQSAYTALWPRLRGESRPISPWAAAGLDAARRGRPVSSYSAVGMFGYHAGPSVHVLDLLGLCDPLLARLPVLYDRRWLPGHVLRTIPRGYVETLETGSNRIEDEELARLYDDLALVVRGDLWTLERWRAIWRLNTGAFATLRGRYPPLAKRTADGSSTAALFRQGDDARAVVGLEVAFGAPVRARAVRLEFADAEPRAPGVDVRGLDLGFLLEGRTLAVVDVEWPEPGSAERARVVPVPEGAIERGFDSVRLLSRRRAWLPARAAGLRSLSLEH